VDDLATSKAFGAIRTYLLTYLLTSGKNLVNLGPVLRSSAGAKMCTHRRSAVWLRPLGGATARPCGISTEFCGAISRPTQFCFNY